MTASVLKQDQNTQKVQKNADFNGEPVRLVGSNLLRLSFHFKSCGLRHCLTTLSLTIMKR